MSKPGGRGGAWGSKAPPSSILQAAAAGQPSSGGGGGRNSNNNNNNNRGGGGGGRGGGRGRGGGGGGGRNNEGGRGRGGGGGGGRDSNNNNMDSSNNGRGKQKGGRGGGRGNNPQNSNNNNNNNNNNNKGGRGGGGNNNKQDNSNNNNNNNNGSRKELSDIHLLYPGSGANEIEKSVARHSASTFLSCRLQYLDPPDAEAAKLVGSEVFCPHEKALWSGPKSLRVDQIQSEMDVLWNYAPLNVNEETRWKPKVMISDEESAFKKEQEEEDAEKLRKAFAILNKMSWTTLEKLTKQFLQELGSAPKTNPDDNANDANNSTKDKDKNAVVYSVEIIKECMSMIVEKAMLEPHFAELYAVFSTKLSNVNKIFKKTLLSLCQDLFESTDKEPELSPDLDPAEREFQLTQSRKKSIGLMHFIGELYKLGLIRGEIMISCLKRLLVLDDEERLECFARLMTTIGSRLHDEQDDDRPEMKEIWEETYSMAGRRKKGPKAPSTRIKFLLQDLIELKENDWVKRREEEKAKTLAEIHRQVEEEEQAALVAAANQNRRGGGGSFKSNNNSGDNMKRSTSTGGMLNNSNKSPWKGSNPNLSSTLGAAASSSSSLLPPPPPPADEDGFVQVKTPKRTPLLRHNKSDNSSDSGDSGGESSKKGAAGPNKSSLQFAVAAGGGGRSTPGGKGKKQNNKANNSTTSSNANSNNKRGGPTTLTRNEKPESSLKAAAAAAGQTTPARTISPTAGAAAATTPPSKTAAVPVTPPPSNNKSDESGLSPKECGEKMKNLLKEYFIGGDTDDAILSVDELVGAVGKQPGHLERSAAVIEAGVLLVMEMKEQDVRNFLKVASRALQEGKIDKDGLVQGLNDPLEFLRDIEIDAPLASSFLSIILAEWLQLDLFSFTALLKSGGSCPEYFLTDGRPAELGVQVLSKLDRDPTDSEIDVVNGLMNDQDKGKHSSALDWIKTLKSS